MRKYVFATLCATAAMLAGCDKPAGGEETGSGITVTGGTTIAVAADQTTATLSITAEAAWTASIESGAEWLLEVTPASGEAGSHTLTLNFTANETETARTATVRLASGDDAVTVTLNQKGTNDEGGEQPAGGAILKEMIEGEGAIVLTTDAEGRITGCEWRAGTETIYSEEFAYGDNQLVWSMFFADNDDQVYNCVMENGRVMTTNFSDGWQRVYTYNADGTLAKGVYVDAQGQEADFCTYTWTDGNLTRIAEKDFTKTIEYGEQESGIANFDPVLRTILGDSEDALFYYRLLGPVNRNLPISCTTQIHDPEGNVEEEYSLSYEYEFGENGALSKIYISGLEGALELKY